LKEQESYKREGENRVWLDAAGCAVKVHFTLHIYVLQAACLVERIEDTDNILDKIGVWIDYCCIPQGSIMTKGEQEEETVYDFTKNPVVLWRNMVQLQFLNSVQGGPVL
jgi:hypothetical protein